MWKRAAIAVILACAISVWVQTPSSVYHTSLISLGKRFPIVKTIGEYFHQTETKGESRESSTKAVKTKSKSINRNDGKYDWMKGPKIGSEMKLLREEDIKYNEGGKLFLVIVGHVFDVSEGENYYKPGSGYFGFIGQDASRAFVTGEFDEKGLVSDISGLSNSDYRGLAEWLKFYLEHEQYVHKGYLVGRFFDENGKETDYMQQFKTWVNGALKEENDENDLKKIFPPCNVEWTADTGTEFHCSSLSGGISRDWVGVPRQFFQEGSTTARCACVHPNYLADPRIKEYENCDGKSIKCKLPN